MFPVGLKIVELRLMTDEERELMGWDWSEPAVVLTLSDGSLLYPSQDAEGNGPGVIFYQKDDGGEGIVGYD